MSLEDRYSAALLARHHTVFAGTCYNFLLSLVPGTPLLRCVAWLRFVFSDDTAD